MRSLWTACEKHTIGFESQVILMRRLEKIPCIQKAGMCSVSMITVSEKIITIPQC